jgi:hypothetical protein
MHKTTSFPSIPVDLVGYDVDLIPAKASVQCRRFDPATGNVLLFAGTEPD